MNFYLEKASILFGFMALKKKCLPDFICIGGQKSGTNWLMNNLEIHPSVFLPDLKPYFDIHYFDINFRKPIQWYYDFFYNGRNQIKGENTPAYGIMPLSKIFFLRRVLPDLKIILLVRNPVDRAWSHAKMNFRDIYGTLEGIDDDLYIRHFNSFRSLSRGRFSSIIKNWTTVFPKERLLIQFYHEIAENPEMVFSNVLKHIEAEVPESFENYKLKNIFNKGDDAILPDRFREKLYDLYASEALELKNLMKKMDISIEKFSKEYNFIN